MVRILTETMVEGTKRYIEAACLSTDTKPVGDLVTGSLMWEVDTTTIYAYDEDAASGSEWVEQMALKPEE